MREQIHNRCVMCGRIIPEGIMVCPLCEKRVLRQELPVPILDPEEVYVRKRQNGSKSI